MALGVLIIQTRYQYSDREFVEQNADPWYRQPAYVKRNFRLLGSKQGRPSATAKVNKKQEN